MTNTITPYSFINSINGNKTQPYTSAYVPFITARTMSYFSDTIVYAALVNEYQIKDPEMHYDLFQSAVRPRRRFAKWGKPTKDPDLDMISEYFQINKERAAEYKAHLKINDLKIIADQIKLFQ